MVGESFNIDPGTPAPGNEPDPTPTPGADDVPEAIKGKSPQEIAADIEEQKQENERLRGELHSTNERFTKFAVSALSGAAAGAPAPAEETIPDAEEDPEGHRDAVIKKQVADSVAAAIQPLTQEFRQTQAVAFSGGIEAQKLKMRGDPKFGSWAEVEEEVMTYLGQFTPAIQASPGAMEEAYYRALGKRQSTEDTKKGTPPPLETGGRSSASLRADEDFPVRETPLNDSGKFFAGRSGMKEKEFQSYQGAGVMSLDEHQALQAKLKAKKGK